MDWLTNAPIHPESAPAHRPDRTTWKVLIVDDEEDVHAVTKLALGNQVFLGRPIEFLDAYSGQEAVDTVRREPEVAVILMDVVMETDRAGLDAIQEIRKDLGNRMARIILRTGHPGQAPENEIITKYDIDDYKEKAELTKKRLYTSIYVALRSYRDLRALEKNRKGLEQVIRAATHLQELRGISDFANGVLSQLSALLHADSEGFIARDHGFASLDGEPEHEVIAATGKFESQRDLTTIRSMLNARQPDIERNLMEPGTQFGDGWFSHCIASPTQGRRLSVYMESDSAWSSLDRQVLELFSHNVAIGLDNLLLNKQVYETQRELVLMLGEAIEARSMEAGQHVARVAEYSALLATLIGLESDQVEILRLAAPLHDIGKIAIEDSILNKPGRHTPDESKRMKEHAQIGATLLEGHSLPVLDAAAQIAAGHHENWNGSGYPKGLSGDQIPIFGRIVALADVFDALRSSRCYKPAWPLEDALAFVREQRGIKFDPLLCDMLLSNTDEFVAISDRLAA